MGVPPLNLAYGITYQQIGFGPFSSSEMGIDLSYFFEQFNAPRVITVRELQEASANGEDIFAVDDSDFDFMAAPEGYFLMNFIWRSNIKSFEFLFKVENLLNNSYRSYTDQLRYFADDVGINYHLSFKYKF